MSMVENQNRILAVIPARGGSKGLENKNLRHCDGVSLLGWAIDIAQFMGFDIVITTDSDLVETYAENREINVRRTHGDYLHSDTCKSIDVWDDAWDREKYPISVLLEPTCPTRQTEDIERCLAMLDKYSSAMTISEATPKEKLFRVDNGTIQKEIHIPRRQDCLTWYKANGACYARRADHEGELVDNAGAVIIDSPRVSIDDIYDLWVSEAIIQSAEKLFSS